LSYKLYHPTPAELDEVAQLLIQGELAAVPSETVYGLAGHALNPTAVAQIFAVKGRPLIDPLIVHVFDLEQAETLAYFDERAKKCAQCFWPGPLTLILPRKNIVPDLITAGLPTVAIRCPAHPVFREILKRSAIPLAAPSANPFGYISPSKAEHVQQMLGSRLKAIVDGGNCEHGVESTILDCSQPQLRILRPGPISARELEAKIGESVVMYKKTQHSEHQAQLASGMLDKHYSPRKPAFLWNEIGEVTKDGAVVYLARPSTEELARGQVYWLSEAGALTEMMHNLYDLLHRLDAGEAPSIWIQRPVGLVGGEALLDRVTRACSK
jgi:L-threonylcarbamoyladenylate synthase